MKKLLFMAAICGSIAFLLPHAAKAAELVVNGGFETGNFTGWTAVNAANSFINWTVGTGNHGGGYTPPNVVTPAEGSRSAWQGVAANAGTSYTLSQDVAIPAGTATLTWKDRFQSNLRDFCGGSNPACGTQTYRMQILNTSNVVLQTLYIVTASPGQAIDTGWQNHFFNLTPYAGTTVRIRFSTSVTATWDGPGQLDVDAVSIQSPGVVTAANAAVGGRVSTDKGTGISRVGVTLTDSAGNIRTATTNSFGYYKFDEVVTGETYILTVGSKKYLFTNSPRVVSVENDLTDVDFVASP